MQDRAVSFNAVIDVMHEMWGDSGELLDALKELPSVTPQLYGDAISRKDAEKRIDEALSKVFVNSDGIGKGILSKLPSITPQRPKGKWINGNYHISCSECGEDYPYRLRNFCPNCGADMRGDKNER